MKLSSLRPAVQRRRTNRLRNDVSISVVLEGVDLHSDDDMVDDLVDRIFGAFGDDEAPGIASSGGPCTATFYVPTPVDVSAFLALIRRLIDVDPVLEVERLEEDFLAPEGIARYTGVEQSVVEDWMRNPGKIPFPPHRLSFNIGKPSPLHAWAWCDVYAWMKASGKDLTDLSAPADHYTLTQLNAALARGYHARNPHTAPDITKDPR